MQDAQANKPERAQTFIVFCQATKPLARNFLRSAMASGNDTDDYIFVSTDGARFMGQKVLHIDLPQGAPITINRAFMAVAQLCYNDKQDFIFLDSDVTFVKPEAVEKMTYELKVRDGTVLALPVWVHNKKFHGWVFNGNAAYSWKTWEAFNLENEPIPDDEEFNLFLSRKFYQGHVAPTGLHHQTMPLRRVENLDFLQDCVVMHHPCKDSSMADLVVSKYLDKEVAPHA